MGLPGDILLSVLGRAATGDRYSDQGRSGAHCMCEGLRVRSSSDERPPSSRIPRLTLGSRIERHTASAAPPLPA
ncbi:hypothetical protein NDU88_005656 [Pleurodeles waltl]|uniref:Uncharacterized protein n=1 Tax=Pleurodeles waltl TaxID=8319 RepID=A0AAV7W8G4_PLEWA|nr:hypothetical protein NDU88_005656 [Pleurodeles waltl]